MTGYLDPYAPMLDKGNSDFDIRHRVTITAIYAVPAFKNSKGIVRQVLGGWDIAPIFTARSGSPYSIFDGGNAFTFDARAAFTAPIPVDGNGTVSTGAPNSFRYLSFPDSAVDHYVNPLYFFSDVPPFPSNMSGRNTFRSPGFYELDLGVHKNFQITETIKVQFRGEAFNLMNHANLYVLGSGAELQGVDPTDGGTSSINACRGCTGLPADRRNIQLAIKLIF